MSDNKEYTREDLIPLIGKKVNITHNGCASLDIEIKDVGQKTVFAGWPTGTTPDKQIQIKDIRSVTWEERKRRRLNGRERI